MKEKVRKYRFYFANGDIGKMRTNAVWNKKTVKEYNNRVGKKILKKVVKI